MSRRRIISYLSFEEARSFVQELNLNNYKDWLVYAESPSRPANIPKNPYIVYAEKGWISFDDFIIGDKTDKSKIKGKFNHKNALPFDEARTIARQLGLNDSVEWVEYFSIESNRLRFIPLQPQLFYRGKGWQGWQDWLGSGFLSFETARDYCRTLGLIGNHDWVAFSSSGRRPKNIPSNPRKHYRSEWVSWRDFLRNIETQEDKKYNEKKREDFVGVLQ